MTEKAIFGAGCFWGVEAAFRAVKGVSEVVSGYSGGHFKNPSYHDVCTGKTGHAEVVQVKYDPSQVDYDALLNVFWDCHNPTTRNRQGPDVGTQYRSAIFFYTPEQEAAAIQQQLQSILQRALQDPALQASIQAFQAEVVAKMTEIEPETTVLLARLNERD